MKSEETFEVKSIFNNIEKEFKNFKTNGKASKIGHFFNERNIIVKYAKSSLNHKTIGVFKGKKINGLAFMIYSDKNLYYGSFVNSKKEGYGIHLYSNGLCFQGSYSNDKKASGVVIEYSTGKIVYEGGWQNDTYQGLGYFYNPKTGSTYIGQFDNGKMCGFGKKK